MIVMIIINLEVEQPAITFKKIKSDDAYHVE